MQLDVPAPLAPVVPITSLPDSEPLVSCIMPTSNRREFVSRAIRLFQRQDYPRLELVIVDDGGDPVADCMPDDPRIKYVRRAPPLTIGAKRNLACAEARGAIIAHWDDDDWYPPHRIRTQVRALLDRPADLCGSSRIYFYEPATGRAWRYQYAGPNAPWVAGSTLVYRRSYWERNRFADLQVGEDTHFVWGRAPKVLCDLADPSLCVAALHPGNTARKDTGGPFWHPEPAGAVRQWLEEDSAGNMPTREIVGRDLDLSQVQRPPVSTPTGAPSMKLNLGCCDALLPDYVNVDAVAAPGVEVVDLRQPWPWPDDSVEHVRAWDIIEHLPDKIFTMNELWRVLKAGGTAEIVVPTTEGPGAFQDPTHVSFWNRRSFLYYEVGNPYRERFARSYGIEAKFRILSERTDSTQDGPKLTIMLQAVKP